MCHWLHCLVAEPALSLLVCCAYQVTIRTSDIRGAGTDAQVHVELIDVAGSSSGVKELAAAGPEAFKRGKVDWFKLSCQPLGEVAQLKVGHDGSGAHPAWHLLQVCAVDC